MTVAVPMFLRRIEIHDRLLDFVQPHADNSVCGQVPQLIARHRYLPRLRRAVLFLGCSISVCIRRRIRTTGNGIALEGRQQRTVEQESGISDEEPIMATAQLPQATTIKDYEPLNSSTIRGKFAVGLGLFLVLLTGGLWYVAWGDLPSSIDQTN